MKFKDLKFNDISSTHGEGATQVYLEFKNGYEASVVKHKYSYGGDKGLYEIGIFGPHGGMCDPLDWGDDVKGWLTPELVEKELELIDAIT